MPDGRIGKRIRQVEGGRVPALVTSLASGSEYSLVAITSALRTVRTFMIQNSPIRYGALEVNPVPDHPVLFNLR